MGVQLAQAAALLLPGINRRPGVGAGPQGRRDPRHRTDPLGPAMFAARSLTCFKFRFVSSPPNRSPIAYYHVIGQFLDWCQRAGFGNLEDIEPIHLAAHTEHHPGAAATFKQHIAAIRMLFSWLTEKRHLGNEPGVRGQDTEVFPERRQDAGSLSLTDLDQLFFSALLVQPVNKVALWKGGIGIMTLNILGLSLDAVVLTIRADDGSTMLETGVDVARTPPKSPPGKASPLVFPKSRYRKKGSAGGMATRAPFYGLTFTANSMENSSTK
jgi:hypothetical protein